MMGRGWSGAAVKSKDDQWAVTGRGETLPQSLARINPKFGLPASRTVRECVSTV